MGKIISFTGPRPKNLYGYNDMTDYNKLINEKLIPVIEKFINKGFDEFYSGGAQGFDQCAFLAVNYLKQKYPHIQNKIILPYHGYGLENKWIEKGLFGKEFFQKNILSKADDVLYATDGGYELSSLFDRNHELVKKADLIIAYYLDDDWSDKKTPSGTAECMRYAKKKEKPILQIKEDGVHFVNIVHIIEPSTIGQQMLAYQDFLGKTYMYHLQPEEIANNNLIIYYHNLPSIYDNVKKMPTFTEKGFTLPGYAVPIFNRSNVKLADKYDRLVVGQYGAFLEIDDADINKDVLCIKKGQEYRVNDSQYRDHIKYEWYTTKDQTNCKLYHQIREVSYADYKPGKWYISPYETKYELDTESFLSPKRNIFSLKQGILCQQVNCKGRMNAGLAKRIAETFPEVKQSYMEAFRSEKPFKLGQYDIVKIPYSDISVANIYAQDDYGNPQKTHKIYTDKDILARCIKQIALAYPEKTVYIPYNIGCGYGGETWENVFSAIDDVVHEEHLTNVQIIDTKKLEIYNPFVDYLEYAR